MAFFQTKTLWINQLADGVAALVLDVPDHKVNVLTPRVFDDLETALDRVVAEPSFELLLIRSGKPGNFCAGADIHLLGELKSAREAVALSERGQVLFQRIADLRVPSVAVISGTCFGGGAELAMACDYRVVVDQPRTQIAFAEMELGILPAWGGTQRLPRLVGLENALQLLLAGRRLTAREAVRQGFADDVSADDQSPPAFLTRTVKRPLRAGLPLRTWRQKMLESTGVGKSLIFRGTRRLLRRRLPEDMPAPWRIVEAVRLGLRDGFQAGLDFERQTLGELVQTPACHNLVHLFLMREQARKIPPTAKQEAKPIRRVGVIGGGQMGSAIAHWAAMHGCEVVLREVDEITLAMGVVRILAFFKQGVESGQLTPRDYEERLARVHGTSAWKGFGDLDLIVEAVPENLGLKRQIMRDLEPHVSRSALVVSTTSSLCIAELGEGLAVAGRLAGLHFFHPAHRTVLVELAAGPTTQDEVISRLTSWLIRHDKVPMSVRDSPGFLIHRVLLPYLSEAVLLVSEGLPVERVDQAMKRFGMVLGPLEWLDLVGLDYTLQTSQRLAAALGEDYADRVVGLSRVEALCQAGWLGQKNGIGFYRHRGKPGRINHHAVNVLRGRASVAAPYQMEARSVADQLRTARERLLPLVVNQAVYALEQQLAADADAIDLAMVLGAGWPRHRGGPLRYASQTGMAQLESDLRALVEEVGPRYQPSPMLLRKVQEGTSFYPNP
jgi:3-hydroxyacyl-CoA dehydrogenase/enoyl-CoA hydratase/3-hydroxybutyryl-CoA epimerase